MKKTYIAPVTKFIFLDPAESMMTLTGSNGGLDDTSYSGNTSDVDLPDGGDSNRRSIWGNTEW